MDFADDAPEEISQKKAKDKAIEEFKQERANRSKKRCKDILM